MVESHWRRSKPIMYFREHLFVGLLETLFVVDIQNVDMRGVQAMVSNLLVSNIGPGHSANTSTFGIEPSLAMSVSTR